MNIFKNIALPLPPHCSGGEGYAEAEEFAVGEILEAGGQA
jgi:hypothetical protein